MSNPKVPRSAAALLAGSFSRNGYVRQQNPERLNAEGYEGYKKGDEIRLIADSRRELSDLRRSLQQAQFSPGKPFEKGNRWCQPIYGREEVSRFLRVVGGRRRASR